MSESPNPLLLRADKISCVTTLNTHSKLYQLTDFYHLVLTKLEHSSYRDPQDQSTSYAAHYYSYVLFQWCEFNEIKSDFNKTMKLSMVAFAALLGMVLANDTVPMPPGAESACKSGGGMGGGVCCSYSDCETCGFFYQRCCYKSDRNAYSRGACLCGVNSYPQGTCF